MRHEHETARRHAYNTISDANRHLDRTTNPRRIHMLNDMIRNATSTLNNLDRLESRQLYSHTGIGYGRRYRNDAINDVLDMVDRILPHLADDYSDDDYSDYSPVDRRGVARPGIRDRRKTSPIRGGKGRRRRYYASADYDDRYSDDWTDDRHDERYSNDDGYRNDRISDDNRRMEGTADDRNRAESNDNADDSRYRRRT